MIKIKPNKELFEELSTLSHRVKTWAGYVQGNFELSQDDIKTFIKMADTHIEELKEHKNNILKHIMECNK